MKNEFKPRCASIYGLPPNFSISDVPRSYQTSKQVLTGVVATTLSDAVATACHGVQVLPALESPDVTCTIELYQVTGTDDELVMSWDVTESNLAALFAGNLEHIDLEGKPIKIKVVDPTGGWVSVAVRKTY